MPSDAAYDDRLIREAIARGAMSGLLKWCELTLGQAVRQAPIEEGTLRGAGTIEDPNAEQVIAAMIGAGVAEVYARIIFPLVYAAYQERGMRADGTYVIQNHPKGGKIHYLSDPVKANIPLLEPMMAAGVRESLQGMRA